MTTWPPGVGLIERECVSSTMEEAARLAPEITAPTWIFAHEQSSPRGRRGRAWHQGAGNFAATLLMDPQCSAPEMALRSFVASLAVYDALCHLSVAPGHLALKWPNDVLLRGGKVSGILLERLASGHLCVGIGINLVATPDMADLDVDAIPPVSVLTASGVKISPKRMLDALAEEFARLDNQLTQQGFASILALWLSRAARLGEEVVVKTSRETLRGIFDSIDADGQLILETPQGRVKIAAGSVFF